MRSAMERGKWVFFQNCHLAPSWMPTLERLIENIDSDKVCLKAKIILFIDSLSSLPRSCDFYTLIRFGAQALQDEFTRTSQSCFIRNINFQPLMNDRVDF